MKRVGRKVPKPLQGEFTESLAIEDADDIWSAYNLILTGDIVFASAIRNVNSTSATGYTSTKSVHTELAIEVETRDLDPASSSLRVSGKVILDNPYVTKGSRHTIEFKEKDKRSFTLVKPDGWNSVEEETLKKALSPDKPGTMVAVLMQEGEANICTIRESGTASAAHVFSPIPKKRSTVAEQDAGMARFFQKVLSTLLEQFDFSQPRPLLLGSPGQTAKAFKDHIKQQGHNKSDKVLTAMSREATVVQVSSCHEHNLMNPKVQEVLKDTQFAIETKYMDKLTTMLKVDDGRAWYGTSAVSKAVNDGAIGPGGGVLLISQSLVNHDDIATRKKYVAMKDKVKANGGEARIVSDSHQSGKQLMLLGNIAAILSYPMLDLDEDDEHVAADDDEHGQHQGTANSVI